MYMSRPARRRGRKKAAAGIMLVLIGLGALGYYQYVQITAITAEVVKSDLINEDAQGITYGIYMEFDNPSLIPLAAGKTGLILSSGDQVSGVGTIEELYLGPMTKSIVYGTFYVNNGAEPGGSTSISGVAQYDLGFTTVEVPFEYYPTDGQMTDFIRQL